MSQIIVLLTIWSDRMPRPNGPDPIYTSRCNGRKLTDREVLQLELANREDLAVFSPSRTVRGKNISFTRDGGEIAEWYEVNPGDEVSFYIQDFVKGDTPDGAYTFIIPEGGLSNPPSRVDDPRLGDGPHRYYLEHATRVD